MSLINFSNELILLFSSDAWLFVLLFEIYNEGDSYFIIATSNLRLFPDQAPREFKLLDVRSEQEFKLVHIEKSVNIPLETLSER